MDSNGQVIEEMLDEENLVCLNDGSNTRIDVNTERVCAGSHAGFK